MSDCPFCNVESESESRDGKKHHGVFRRGWESLQWVFPAAMLVLIPKCPICVAAYVALFTGVGVSVATARWIQVLMLAFCLTSLAFLVIRIVRRRRAA